MSAESSMPPLRPATRLYAGALAAAALAVLLATLLTAGWPTGGELTLQIALTLAVTVALARPLAFASRAQVYLDTIPITAAILLLEPGHAIAVAAIGAVVAGLTTRRTSAEVLFNASQFALMTAGGALVLRLVDWQPGGDFTLPKPLLATLLAGVTMYATNFLALAGVISFQDRVSVLGVWYDLAIRANRTEIATYLAQLGTGLLAAVVYDAERWAIALLAIPAGAVYVALEQHVEMRRRAEANLEAAQRLVRLGSWDWDLRTGDLRWSDELYDLLGFTRHDVQADAERYLGVVHPDDRTTVSAALGAAAASGASYTLDHRLRPADGGEERIVHARGDVVRDRHGRTLRVVGTVHDITERKRLEERLAHQAYHDPLTDLPNRLYFTQQLNAIIAREGARARLAVLFLDLDRFKLINDTFGHEAGDQLLVTVAGRLRACTRPGDIVARLGGDEFTILLRNAASDDDAVAVAARIITEITEPIVLLGTREIVVSTSIGIVRPGPDQAAGADLLRDADNALYRAKERGRNQYAVFDATMGAQTQERVALEADLRRAIQRDELRVLYQPKVDLHTGGTVAVEAFLRWQHPIRGWVPPSAFIPIAEETGMMPAIGRWVMEEACREAVTWAALGSDAPALSVNLSGKQLHDPRLLEEIGALLAGTGLPAHRLRLEITETVAMQNADATIQALWRLQKLGVRVVIDDFGTGYSSLSSLQRFPVDTLQLDHSFVANLGRGRESLTIAQAVIGLAHGLGLKVVAEGVERPEQADQLRELGCEQAQGNLFSVPLTSYEISAYLTRQRRAPEPPAHLPAEPAPTSA